MKIALVILGGISGLIGISRIIYPDGYDQIYLCWAINDLILEGKNPWRLDSVTTEPYTIADYGPFLHLYSAVGQGFLGKQYWFQRTVSFLGFLITCWCVWRLARMDDVVNGRVSDPARITSNKSSIFALLCYLTNSVVIAMVSHGRGDFLGLTASILGITVLLASANTASPSIGCLIAGVLTGSAPLFKQNFISAILAGSFVACKIGKLRPYLSTAIGIPLFVASSLTLTSQGGFLTICLKYPGMFEKSFEHGLAVWKSTFLSDPGNAVLGTVFATIALNRFRMIVRSKFGSFQEDSLVDNTLWIWWGLSGFIGFMTTTRHIGGSPQYYLEFLVIVSVIVGREMGSHARKSSPANFREARFLTVVSLLLFMSGILFEVRSVRRAYFQWRALPYLNELATIIQENTDPNESVFSEFSQIPFDVGRTVLFNDPLMYMNTTNENRELVRKHIREKRFSCLVLQPRSLVEYSEFIPSKYVEFPTRNPYPPKVFAVKVYLRRGQDLERNAHSGNETERKDE
jgi:hypothetical protein